MKQRKRWSAAAWNRLVLAGSLGVLLLIAAGTVIIDPFLHYHGPLAGLQYPLKDERYVNDGIARHYDYTAVITGTSMTQNFKASQFEELWGERTVKIGYSGASFREVNDAVRRALSYNEGIRYVVRSLDGNRINYPADQNEYEGYPEYLYDNDPFNDVQYLLNKEVMTKSLAVVNYTRAGNRTPTMDEYGSWGQYQIYGREQVLKSAQAFEGEWEELELSEEDRERIRENVETNVLDIALENPEVTFYVFFPPYSIVYWEALAVTKQLNAQLEAEQMTVEILLQADNIEIYAFADEVEMAADLDNYSDALHYGPWINERILEWMHAGSHRLQTDNYMDYYREIREIYLNYPYGDLSYTTKLALFGTKLALVGAEEIW